MTANPQNLALKILSMNVEGIQTNKVYVQHLVSTFKPHILSIQEHWLFRFEVNVLTDLFPEYEYVAKCVDDNNPLSPIQRPRGYGGVAILWDKSLKDVRKLEEGSERSAAIQLEDYVITTSYLPCRGTYSNSEFLEELAQLQEIVTKFQSSKLIITGDINVDIHKQQDVRTKALHNFIDELQLTDITPTEQQTFFHHSGNSSSKIDYIFLNPSSKSHATDVKCTLKPKETANTSPHTPILLSLAPFTPKLQSSRCKQQTYLLWEKADIELYEETIEAYLSTDIPVSNSEEAIKYLMYSIKEATKLAVPVKTPRNKLSTKPWNDEIKALFKKSKQIDYQWKNSTDVETLYMFNRRKFIKKLLRKAQRIQIAKQRDTLITEIMEANTQDQNLFFKLVKRQRKQPNSHTQVLEYEGKKYFDDLLPVWTRHFGSLAQPSNNPYFDEAYSKQVSQDVDIIKSATSNPTPSSVPITNIEVKHIISQLKKKKAKDEFDLSSEHIIYGGGAMSTYIAKILNSVVNDMEIPKFIKTAINHPIPKKDKDSTIPGNSRGISICPIVAKIIDSMSISHQKAAISEHSTDLQFGFTESRSPSHATILLSELMIEAKEQKKPIYICTLDVQKAFDVVSHDSLLRKLHLEGLPPRWWQLKYNSYQDMSTRIIWKGEIGESYLNLQGNRQGGKGSASDFKTYIINIIRLLARSLYGIHIGATYLGVLACADDLILAATSMDDLYCQIALVNMYANQERFVIHPQKSSIAIQGISELEFKSLLNHNPWQINNQPVTINNEFTHLGVNYNFDLNSPTSPTIDNRLSLARKTTYALMGSGFHGVNGLKPTVSMKIFETYVIPRIMYSLESINISITDMKRLEIHQRTVIRQLQSLPTRTANAALYILVGILPMEARIHKKRLSIIPSILKNQVFREIIPRQLAVKTTDSSSWVVKTQEILRLYDLPSILELLENPPPDQPWKKSVKTAIHKFWKQKLEDETVQKSTLKYLSPIFNQGISHNVWKLCTDSPSEVKKAIVKVKLMTNTYNLQSNKTTFNQISSPECLLCHTGDEDVPHFLIMCPVFEEIRKPIIQEIISLVPIIHSNHPTIWSKEDLCHLIMDSTHPDVPHFNLSQDDICSIEEKSRQLCYSLHKARAKMMQYKT